MKPLLHQAAAILALAFFLPGSAQAGTFTKKQRGTYEGSAKVTAVIHGAPIPAQTARGRVVVRVNAIVLDGTKLPLAGGVLNFQYSEQGITMVCEGTYTEINGRVQGGGTVRVVGGALAMTGQELNGTWSFDFVANGRRCDYKLFIHFPDPNSEGTVLATITGKGSGEKVR